MILLENAHNIFHLINGGLTHVSSILARDIAADVGKIGVGTRNNSNANSILPLDVKTPLCSSATTTSSNTMNDDHCHYYLSIKRSISPRGVISSQPISTSLDR